MAARPVTIVSRVGSLAPLSILLQHMPHRNTCLLVDDSQVPELDKLKAGGAVEVLMRSCLVQKYLIMACS